MLWCTNAAVINSPSWKLLHSRAHIPKLVCILPNFPHYRLLSICSLPVFTPPVSLHSQSNQYDCIYIGKEMNVGTIPWSGDQQQALVIALILYFWNRMASSKEFLTSDLLENCLGNCDHVKDSATVQRKGIQCPACLVALWCYWYRCSLKIIWRTSEGHLDTLRRSLALSWFHSLSYITLGIYLRCLINLCSFCSQRDRERTIQLDILEIYRCLPPSTNLWGLRETELQM